MRWLMPACLYHKTALDGLASAIHAFDEALETVDSSTYAMLKDVRDSLVATPGER